MVYRRQRHSYRLASVRAAAAAAAAADAAAAAAADAVAAAVAGALGPARRRRTERLLYHHLWTLHRRSERDELHSLAQLSVELRQQPGVLHHADFARHRKAPDRDLL